MRSRSLPLICTGISRVCSTSHAGQMRAKEHRPMASPCLPTRCSTVPAWHRVLPRGAGQKGGAESGIAADGPGLHLPRNRFVNEHHHGRDRRIKPHAFKSSVTFLMQACSALSCAGLGAASRIAGSSRIFSSSSGPRVGSVVRFCSNSFHFYRRHTTSKPPEEP